MGTEAQGPAPNHSSAGYVELLLLHWNFGQSRKGLRVIHHISVWLPLTAEERQRFQNMEEIKKDQSWSSNSQRWIRVLDLAILLSTRGNIKK